MSYDFIGGMLAAGDLVATLFFLRFWRQTGERIFAWLAAAFAAFALQPISGLLFTGGIEDDAELYLIRLAGFVLIIVGIVAANRRRAIRREPAPE